MNTTNNKSKLLLILAISFFSNFAFGLEEPTLPVQADLKVGAYLKLEAASGKGKELSKFLVQGAKIVKETEPQTKYWFALKENENIYGIFDAFPSEADRDTHFSGKVAAALKDQAPNLIIGGWDNGVAKNINNLNILASSISKNVSDSKEASLILLTAKPGQEKDLEEFLRNGAKIVQDSEPKTLFWVALKLDAQHFAIFDTFANDAGRKAHFNGKVAKTLQEKATDLVIDGWDKGVLKNVHNMKVIANVVH